LAVGTPTGPYTVAVDASHVYWTWGGIAGAPVFIARASKDSSNVDERFQRGSGDALYVAFPKKQIDP
jgi:hypothetical protein